MSKENPTIISIESSDSNFLCAVYRFIESYDKSRLDGTVIRIDSKYPVDLDEVRALIDRIDAEHSDEVYNTDDELMNAMEKWDLEDAENDVDYSVYTRKG